MLRTFSNENRLETMVAVRGIAWSGWFASSEAVIPIAKHNRVQDRYAQRA